MTSMLFARRVVQTLGTLALAITVSGCGLESQDAPAITAPSEFGLALTLSATPDTVSRDGSSMSVVTVTARDAEGRAVAGQRVSLSLLPGNGGTLSASDVVTGADGRATFEFRAPPSSTAVDAVSILATPVGQNFDNAVRAVAVDPARRIGSTRWRRSLSFRPRPNGCSSSRSTHRRRRSTGAVVRQLHLRLDVRKRADRERSRRDVSIPERGDLCGAADGDQPRGHRGHDHAERRRLGRHGDPAHHVLADEPEGRVSTR